LARPESPTGGAFDGGASEPNGNRKA